jgi:hypothetical protein
MLSVIMLSVACTYSYAECHYAECHYAKCRYAECLSAPKKYCFIVPILSQEQIMNFKYY